MTAESAFGNINKWATLVRFAPLHESLIRQQRQRREYREVPKPQEWLDARAAFVADFERIRDLGIEKGFLTVEACYECGGELVPTTDTYDLEWVDGSADD